MRIAFTFAALVLATGTTVFAAPSPLVVHVDVLADVSRASEPQIVSRPDIDFYNKHPRLNRTKSPFERFAIVEGCGDNTVLVNHAAQLAQTYLDGAIAALAADPHGRSERYRRWFGVATEDLYETVSDRYTLIAEMSDFTTWTYRCVPDTTPTCVSPEGDALQTNAFIGSVDEFAVIYICPPYFELPLMGGPSSSMASVILHEATHFAQNGETYDWAYGVAPCQQLAATKPDEAVWNAASYEYFACNAGVAQGGWA
ncbi:hypothetical protein BD413DRAFT_210160 [Trametes elegans]|nr:hypothetical protein BD413DRAFT_210160 [Trametes elegans]